MSDKAEAMLMREQRSSTASVPWSVRIGLRYRALAREVDGGYLWFWIGSHADYDRMIGSRS
jgi:hypothetical protein